MLRVLAVALVGALVLPLAARAAESGDAGTIKHLPQSKTRAVNVDLR